MVCKLNSVSFAFIVRIECKDNQKYLLHLGIILGYIWVQDSCNPYNITMMNQKDIMRRAIALSEESVLSGGGPFGAVIAKGGNIIAEASNTVTIDHDPTAHAEVNAIRKATQKLGTFDLTGCDIYTSCEPCPMCLGAIYWAHLDRIFYANNRKDAARIGFDDDFIYQEIALSPAERHKQMQVLLPDEARKAFDSWAEKLDKTEY